MYIPNTPPNTPLNAPLNALIHHYIHTPTWGRYEAVLTDKKHDSNGGKITTDIEDPGVPFFYAPDYHQQYVEESCVTQHHVIPGIYPLYTCITICTPMYTRYACIYIIYTP